MAGRGAIRSHHGDRGTFGDPETTAGSARTTRAARHPGRRTGAHAVADRGRSHVPRSHRTTDHSSSVRAVHAQTVVLTGFLRPDGVAGPHFALSVSALQLSGALAERVGGTSVPRTPGGGTHDTIDRGPRGSLSRCRDDRRGTASGREADLSIRYVR